MGVLGLALLVGRRRGECPLVQDSITRLKVGFSVEPGDKAIVLPLGNSSPGAKCGFIYDVGLGSFNVFCLSEVEFLTLILF